MVLPAKMIILKRNQNTIFQVASSGNFSNFQNRSEGVPYHWEKEASSSEDSVTRLLENSLDCQRSRKEPGGPEERFPVSTAETCLINYPGQVVMAKESRI